MLKKNGNLLMVSAVVVLSALWLALAKYDMQSIVMMGAMTIFGVSFCTWIMKMKGKYSKGNN